MQRRFWISLLTLLALLAWQPASAQTPPPPTNGAVLVVATHEAPPFVVKQPDGRLTGPAISLWTEIARSLGLKYEFREVALKDMIDGVADGRFDASVGAMTVTPQRETKVDFTHPYYTTGFGIVTRATPPAWLALFRNFFTWGFLQTVLLLGALLLGVGALFWLAERRANPEQFGKSWRGLGSGFWFSAVTMTTVGYGDKAPRTTAGKLIAIVWMFAAIIVISTFTGMIASSLTAGRLAGAIDNADDLRSVQVGSIRGAAAESWLDRKGVAFRGYPTIEAGLDAVASGGIDAFVYDRPLLRYRLSRRNDQDLHLVSGSFGRQDYALVLPQGSRLREQVNEMLLRRISSPEWSSLVTQTLGDDD